MSSFDIQNQVRSQIELLKQNMQDQCEWERQMKLKDDDFKQQKEKNKQKMPPVRSRLSDMHEYEQRLENLNVHDNKDTEKGEKEPTEVLFKTLDTNELKLNADVFKENGNQQVKNQKFELAVQCYSKAIQIYNKDPAYFCNRALCYLKLNQFKECVDDCTIAITMDPKLNKAYYRRMQSYESLGENILAIKDCQKVMELEPKCQKFKTDYDRIHNNIKNEEIEKEKPKIKWRKSATATEVDFKDKSPHLRSKKPMVRLPIQSSEKRVLQNIPEAVIDRLFDNNTGENLPLPKPERKPLSFSFNKPLNQASPPMKKESPPKIVNQRIPTPKVVAKMEDKAERMADKVIAQKKATDTQIMQKNQVMPQLKDIEPLTGSLLFLPQSGPQFYASWKELAEEKRFLYLKAMVDAKLDVGKILGSTLDSTIFSELLGIVKKYFLHYEVDYLCLLLSLALNREMPILGLFLDQSSKDDIHQLLFEAKDVDPKVKQQIESGFLMESQILDDSN